MPRRRSRLVPYALVLLLALVGCSGGGGSGSSSASGPGDSAGGSAAGAAAPAPAGAGTSSSPDATLGRPVVRTATLVSQVKDVTAAATGARSVAQQAGGFLEQEDANRERDILRLRVPTDVLAPTLDRLAGLGRVSTRSLGSQDVTEQVADVDSRLATQRASVARVRALLDRAQSIADVVAVEGQLTSREADLESLEARAQALHQTVDLAAVDLTLQPLPAAPGPRTTFADGLSAGAGALAATTRALAVGLGALLPFAPVMALLVGSGLWLRRRRAA